MKEERDYVHGLATYLGVALVDLDLYSFLGVWNDLERHLSLQVLNHFVIKVLAKYLLDAVHDCCGLLTDFL